MNKNLWNIKKIKYILKICISLTVYAMSNAWEVFFHGKFVFQKIRMKPRYIVIKSFALPTVSNCLNFIMQFSWMSVFAGEDSNLEIVKRLNIILKGLIYI